MNKLDFLLSELRRIKALGRSTDHSVCHLMYSCDDCALLFYRDEIIPFSFWAIVRRSSRQYYKVVMLVDQLDKCYSSVQSFRNFALTAQFIKNFIRR